MPIQHACVTPNIKSSALKLIATSVTDIALLLVMLVGLFRLRNHDGGMIGMAQLLWRQVRWQFLLARLPLIHCYVSISQGCYLAHACYRGRGSTSGKYTNFPIPLLFVHLLFMFQVFIILDFNGIFRPVPAELEHLLSPIFSFSAE